MNSLYNCSATREDKRRAGQEKTEYKTRPQSRATEPDRVQGWDTPRQGQEEDKAWTQSRATEPDRVQGRDTPRQGPEEDKARTQSRATEPSHRVQGRGQ